MVIHACLVDAHPKFYYEGLVFARAATEIAGVPPSDVVIAVTPSVPPSVRRALGQYATVRLIEPHPHGGAANKVRLAGLPWPAGRTVALLDADVIVLQPYPEVSTVSGVPVFGPSPNADALAAFYGTGRPGDWIVREGLAGPFRTHRNHLNGGLYLMPTRLAAPFAAAWDDALAKVLASGIDVGRYGDQVAAGLAAHALAFAVSHRPDTDAAPPHLARRSPVRAIHDFAKFDPEHRDAAGLLRETPSLATDPPRVALKSIIKAVNTYDDARAFVHYRAFRYALYADDFLLANRAIEAAAGERHADAPFLEDMRVHARAYQRMREASAAAPRPAVGT